MVGELGQSLAGWAIIYAARLAVPAWRKPNIVPNFIADMSAQFRATVLPMSVDVTSPNSLQSTISTAKRTVVLIGGGSMARWFSMMPCFPTCHLSVHACAQTEDDGDLSLLINSSMKTTTLDFFIIISSISSAIGVS